jgi:nitroreductase
MKVDLFAMDSKSRGFLRSCIRPVLSLTLGAAMTMKCTRVGYGLWVWFLAGLGMAGAAELPVIALPTPDQTGGKPVMAALKERQSIREFSMLPLTPQVLSDLLWAGFGVNRPDIDHRTAPSTMNMQEIELYVATAEGLCLYDAKPHQLKPVMNGDLRAKTGGQVALQEAPAVLILVADFSRMTKAKPQDREFYAAIDAGFISQNVYLYCASAGLGTVVHELDRLPLAQAMKLRPEQHIIIAQSVGWPKKK